MFELLVGSLLSAMMLLVVVAAWEMPRRPAKPKLPRAVLRSRR